MPTNEKVMHISREGVRVISPEKRDYLSFERYHAEELREEIFKVREAINELFKEQAELFNAKSEEAEARVNQIDEEVSNLFSEQIRLQQEIEDRYIETFCKNPKEILTVIEEDLLPYISLDAFRNSLESRVRRIEFYNKNQETLEAETSERIKLVTEGGTVEEEETKENYLNFIDYIRSMLYGEISVVIYYGLEEDLEEILKNFATKFYPPPKEYRALLNQPGTNALKQLSNKDFELDEDGRGIGVVGAILEVRNSRGLVPIPKSYDYVQLYCFELLTGNLGYRKETPESLVSKREIEIDVADYQQRRNIKDRKQARKELSESLNYMFDLEVKVLEKKYYDFKTGEKLKKPEKSTWRFRLIDAFQDEEDKVVIKNSKIKVRFNIDLLMYVDYGYITQTPALALSINRNKYPHALKLLQKLSDLLNQNVGKETEGTTTVRTLLKELPELPTYEEVANSNRNFTARIIKPFEDNMNALEEEYGIITWEYCNKNGEPLTQEQLDVFNYAEWEDRRIKYEMTDYPELEERRAERRAIQEARRQGKLQAVKKNAKKKEEAKLKRKGN